MSKRRQACERCRNQKLKCIRRLDSITDSCSRCLQAQAECIVSLRKAPGRPAGTGRSDSSSRRGSIRETSRSPAAMLDDNDPLGSNYVVDNGSLTSDDIFDNPFDLNLDWSDTTLFSTGPLDAYLGDISNSLFNYPGSTTTEPPPLTWASSTEDIAPSNPRFPYHTLDQNYNPGFQLSVLQQKLVKQLLQIRSLSWDITTVLKLESSSFSARGFNFSSDNSQGFNPIIGTFEAISEFEQILNSLRCTISQEGRPETPKFPQEMNISYSLTAMSCYMQLVCIYDCIFSYVLEQASNSPVIRDFILHSNPKICLSGFVIPLPENVIGKSFVELMRLRIKPVESALGLPDDCRISKESNNEQVSERALLLGGKQGQSLLAVLKGHSLGDTSDASKEPPGAIESLKAKMIEMESFE
ncbi:transcription factor [Fusarium austroafricanum]|uniref:Transcription factor n=1 Tax=Fusarium austroafricanum TaxID=2364996 RepID=A0A8H4K6U3_9HYPO|nr:transcription factor [Fusarium austroafricanum]